MYDHQYEREDGSSVPVSQMTDIEIQECLNTPLVELNDSPHVGVAALRERLRIELLIRALGL